MRRIATIHITPEQVLLNGQPLAVSETGKALLASLYKQQIGDYPKFYKMDPLARLGFVASELLLQSVDEEHFVEREDRAIVLVNKSASKAADSRYEEKIQTGVNYFPSPADFVYTLPNIVTGEIAIRRSISLSSTAIVNCPSCGILCSSIFRFARILMRDTSAGSIDFGSSITCLSTPSILHLITSPFSSGSMCTSDAFDFAA